MNGNRLGKKQTAKGEKNSERRSATTSCNSPREGTATEKVVDGTSSPRQAQNAAGDGTRTKLNKKYVHAQL